MPIISRTNINIIFQQLPTKPIKIIGFVDYFPSNLFSWIFGQVKGMLYFQGSKRIAPAMKSTRLKSSLNKKGNDYFNRQRFSRFSIGTGI